jgi:hypothetical protein
MITKSAAAAAFTAALVANGCVCGVAHSDDCVTGLNGDASWCQSSGLVNNLSSDMVIGLTPIGNSPQPQPKSAGTTFAGQAISGQFHGGALLVPPGGSAQIGGPTDVDIDGWGTVELQAGTALCNASELCSFLTAAFGDFENCLQGAADALYDATNGIMPDPSQIGQYIQTAKACRSAVDDMTKEQAKEENKQALPDPEEQSRLNAEKVLSEEVPLATKNLTRVNPAEIKTPPIEIGEFPKIP